MQPGSDDCAPHNVRTSQSSASNLSRLRIAAAHRKLNGFATSLWLVLLCLPGTAGMEDKYLSLYLECCQVRDLSGTLTNTIVDSLEILVSPVREIPQSEDGN